MMERNSILKYILILWSKDGPEGFDDGDIPCTSMKSEYVLHKSIISDKKEGMISLPLNIKKNKKIKSASKKLPEAYLGRVIDHAGKF